MILLIKVKRVVCTGILLSLWCFIELCLAVGVESPTIMVQQTIDEVIHVVTDERLKASDQKSRRRELLEETIGKIFDFQEMAKRSLAGHWKNRNATEHREFVTLFQSLLSHTYAEKIENYSEEKVHYLKERVKDAYAEVQTKIVSPHTEIELDYRLIVKDGGWRVYDVVVNGVSLVKNYRSQFERIIRRSSYEDLVITLRDKSGEISAP